MAQILVPTATQAVGSWTPATNPHLQIDDDSTVSPTGDGNEALSDAVGNNTATTNLDVELATGSDPGVGTGHIIRVRWRHDNPGRSLQAHCELWEGIPGSGTMRAELISAADVGSTEVGSTHPLTAVEADAITDYGNLYLRLWGFGTGGGPGRSLVVELAELEVPDAGPTAVTASPVLLTAAPQAADVEIVGGPTTFFEEPWPGFNGQSFPSARWVSSFSGIAPQQDGNNNGVLRHNDDGGAYGRARAIHDPQTDQEWDPIPLVYDGGGNTRVGISICASDDWRSSDGFDGFAVITPNTGYAVEFQWDTAGIFGFPIQLVKYEGGTGTQLDTADDFSAFLDAQMVVRRADDVVEVFIWPTGNVQPETPTLSFDDSASPLAGGIFQMGVQRASGSAALRVGPLIGSATGAAAGVEVQAAPVTITAAAQVVSPQAAAAPITITTAPATITTVAQALSPQQAAAGPDFRSAGAQAVGTGQSLTPDLPAGHAEGDILLAHAIARHDDDAFTPPDAGWTLVTRQRWNLLHTHAVYWKRRGPTETGGAWTRAGNTTVWAVTLSAWQGCVATGDPIDAVSVGGHDNAAAVTIHTGEQVITLNPDTLIVTAYSSNDDNNVAVTSGTEAYGGTGYHTTLGTDLAQALGYQAQPAAGQSDPITFTQQQNAWDAATTITVALLGAARQTVDLGGGYTLVGATIALTDDDTSVVRVPRPRGVTEDTFLIAVMAFSSAQTQTWTGPAGWTQLGTLRLSGGAEHSSQTWYRVAGAAEDDVYVWESTDNVNHKHLALFAIDGIDAADPVDVHTEATDAPTGGLTLAVTTTGDGALLIAAPVQESHPVLWVNDDGTMVRRYSQWQHDFADDMLLLAVFEETAGVAGTYTRTFSHPEDEDNATGHLIALNAASAAAPVTITASPVAISATAQAPALELGALALEINPATITTTAQAPALELSALALEVNPATIAITAQAPALELSALALETNPAAISANIQATSPEPSALELATSSAPIATTAQAPALELGALALEISPATITAGAQPASPEIAGEPVAVQATPATISASAQAISLQPGAFELEASPAVVSVVAQAPAPGFGALALEAAPAELVLSAQAVSVSTGGVVVQASPAVVAVGAQAPSVVLTATELEVTPAALAVAVQAALPSAGGVVVVASPAELTVTGQTASVAFGAFATEASPTAITATAQPVQSGARVVVQAEPVVVAVSAQAPAPELSVLVVTAAPALLAVAAQASSLSLGPLTLEAVAVLMQAAASAMNPIVGQVGQPVPGQLKVLISGQPGAQTSAQHRVRVGNDSHKVRIGP